MLLYQPGGYVFRYICLSVCLFFICLHENSKSSKQIFLKICMEIGQPMEEVIKFGERSESYA